MCENTTSGFSLIKTFNMEARNLEAFLTGEPSTQFISRTSTFGGMASEEESPVRTVIFLKCGDNFRTTPTWCESSGCRSFMV